MLSFVVSNDHAQQFRSRLGRWFSKAGRSLPWRQTRDPYYILVSEVMLQQTQVDRVIERYQQWLKQFPTMGHLAQASSAEVLTAWSGLGYNRRALALQRIAQIVQHDYHGTFPQSAEALKALPGIGPYTAGALAIFAFEQPVALVDTNIKRVLGRIFLGYKILAKWRDQPELFWQLAQVIKPARGGHATWTYHQALMDFGATICTAKKPRCTACPMRSICKSYPAILQAQSVDLLVKNRRTERLYFGQPRRIWRGRILKQLPHHPQKLSLLKLGQQLQPDWEPSRLSWLQAVVETLAKDNLVSIQKKPAGWYMSLPR